MATATTKPRAVILRRGDDVAVASSPIPAGAKIDLAGTSLVALSPVGLGHKIAIRDLADGDPVRKYGQVIGFASSSIDAGSHVHIHNLRADLFERDYAYARECPATPACDSSRTFRGFLRPDGRVGTRNYIAVVSTVNCSASTSRYISNRFQDRDFRRSHPNVDGVFAITHKGGCGLPFEGKDHQILERVLAGFVHHPNVAAYVLVGLGCEGAYAEHLIEAHQLRLASQPGASTPPKPRVFTIQDEGGVSRTIEAAVRAVEGLLPTADAWRRTEQPASKLCVALECGGSDGNSGVTANPALGVAADLVVAQGGSAVLGETTEIYGAEHLLTRRAVSAEVGRKLVDRIRWWEWYTKVFGAEINNNPSPGNKAGGLSTIYEKSLGALAKAGSTALVDVIDYAQQVQGPGLVFMDTPGYDPVCTTGLVAGGANILVFTTGRGSVLGLRPTPCIKLATNTPMFEKLRDDMDMDAGTILDGEPVEVVGRRLFEHILDVASGEPTKSERAGIGEEEFAPWTIGPTL